MIFPIHLSIIPFFQALIFNLEESSDRLYQIPFEDMCLVCFDTVSRFWDKPNSTLQDQVSTRFAGLIEH
jgi:hypothetical protein